MAESLNLYFFQKANDIASGTFYFDRTWDMESDYRKVSNYPINWHLNPFGDPEWTYMLNRMEYLIDIAQAYHISSEKRFKQLICDLINDWITKNITKEVAPFNRTIDTGIRLLNWKESLKSANVEISATVIDAVCLQVDYLTTNYRLKDDLSNWGILQAIGVLAWKEYLSKEQVLFWQQCFERQLAIQINEEGFHWENSIMYHNQVLLGLIRLQLLDQSYQLQAIISKMSFATYSLCDIFGKQIMQNDSDYTDVCGLLRLSYKITGEQTFNLTSENMLIDIYKLENTDNHQLTNINSFYPLTGLATIRTKNMFCSVHNHAYGSSHSHIMPCHINYTYKQAIIIDPGRYTYVDSQKRSELKSIYSHNSPIASGLIEEQIKNSWDTSVNVEREAIIKSEFEDNHIIRSTYKCQNQLITRYTLILDEELIVFDKYPLSEHKQVNLILDSQIAVSTNYELSKERKLIHNYQDTQLQTIEISKKYNQLEKSSKITLSADDKEVLNYFAVVSLDSMISTERVGQYTIYTIELFNSSYALCMLTAEIQIGSKITRYQNYNLYGKVILIDLTNNKQKIIEI